MGEAEPQPQSFPIVGIGASAGGLEAFTQVLRALPPDTQMGFVLVQHLAPKHESMLTEILSGATRMPVREVVDGMRVEPNRVYVIPPNTNMGILHGVLHLVPRPEIQARHMPIDFFLRSLAEDQKGKAIGVILSGTASDGAIGLKEIKAEGGITLAQDPTSAKYDGMPRAAIAAGVVDLVLSAEDIASELTKIGRHPYLKYPEAPKIPDLPQSEELLGKVFFLLRNASGVDFTYYKHATIKRRIKRRMVLLKIERLSDYVKHIQHKPMEVEALYQDLLIHVTGFFRDPEMFTALKKVILPKAFKQHKPEVPIRIWVPGCSTGEESYSLAIAILEYLGTKAESTPIQIFATDISQAAIDKARAGFYPENITADVSPERLRRFFARADGGYRISKSIRDMCIFARQDLTRDPPFSQLDVISCRNVLIYLGSILQKRALSIFHYALKPSGFLILGTSETIGSYADLFTLADKKHKIYAKKTASARPHFDFSADYAHEKLEPGPGRRHVSISRPRTELQAEVDRVILDRFAPSGVVVNNELQIIQVRGQTGRYLEPATGEASLNLLKMARDDLLLELRAAIHLARRRNTPVRKDGLRVKQNGEVCEVGIEVLPIETGPGERHFIILFHQTGGQAPRKRPVEAPGRKGKSAKGNPQSRRLQQLEQELTATREYLQSIIHDQEATNEELQSANEEVLSSNEELQSTNEELETAKEELQSTNEELNTVNEELQTRNLELSQLNSDLTNLLASVQIPIIMVGNDLRIRRFTPMAEKIFKVIPGDVGRPIGDIKPGINVTNLEQIILEAIDTVSVKEQEVQDADGRWHVMRLRPYKNLENKIDGAVVALLDIDAVKRGTVELRTSAQWAGAAADLFDNPLLVLDTELRVRKANDSFCRAFGVTPPEAENRLLHEMQAGHWGELRAVVEDVLTKGDGIATCEMKSERPQGPLAIKACPVDGANHDKLVLLAIFMDRKGQVGKAQTENRP